VTKDARTAIAVVRRALIRLEHYSGEGDDRAVSWRNAAIVFAGQVVDAGENQDLAYLEPVQLPEMILAGSKVGRAVQAMNAAISAAGEPSNAAISAAGEPSNAKKPRKARKKRK